MALCQNLNERMSSQQMAIHFYNLSDIPHFQKYNNSNAFLYVQIRFQANTQYIFSFDKSGIYGIYDCELQYLRFSFDFNCNYPAYPTFIKAS